MIRPVNKIAAEVDTLLRDLKPQPNWLIGARPYVAAMLSMHSFAEFYGIDPGGEIGRRFLVNTPNWRGEAARRIKDEIRQAIKEAEHVHHTR
jgi:hypothetical protein